MLDAEYDIPDEETRKWAMLCHLGGVASIILTPLVGVIVPIVVWLAKRDISPYVEEQGREAINFQISMFLYCVIISVSVTILKFVFIGVLLWWLPSMVVIAQAGGSIVGAIRAHDGENFRYPLILRFL